MQPDLCTRRATLEPASIDDATRTVAVVWSTGAGVRRRDAAGVFEERLSLEPAHVDLSQFVGGPVLDGHRQDSVENILGVVTSAHVDGRAGHATIKLSERAEPIWRDIKAGVLRSVSVGYVVEKWADSASNGTRTRTAIRWTPKELSIVAVPADPGAATRKEAAMPTTPEVPITPAPPEVPITPPPTELATRHAEIRKLVRAAKLDHQVADDLIDRSATLDQARAELFDRVTASPIIVRHQRIEIGERHDAPEQLVTRMAEALHCRVAGTAPTDVARPYMHRRLVDLAGELLESRGERVRMLAPDAILTRAMHTTGDFATLLTATGNRVLLAAFQAAPNPLRSLARQTTVSDFRTKTTVKLSEWPKLSQVNEHGEITYGTRGEAREAYAIRTYAKIFSLSRTALINDDLGAFSDFGRAAGRAAAETEADVLTALLTANSGDGITLDDGDPLFDTNHGNIAASGTVIDVAALSAARLAMRSQKGLDGVTPVAVVPKYLLVSPTKETSAESVLASLAAATVATVNPFSGRLELLVEPRLSGNGWSVWADPAAMPVLEYAYLSSAQGPQMASREGWDTLGMEFRVVLDFGAGVIDYRGAYRNAGA
jgi:Mu-like prophage major head subunit gpT/Caudovirus prohead serine protease